MRVLPGQLPVQFGRKFHLDSYESSHAQLLFRSATAAYHDGKHLKYDSVTDVLFKNVAALAVSENYFPLEVSLAKEAELKDFQQLLKSEIRDQNLYILRGDDSVGYVLAGAVYWIDDPIGSIREKSVLVAESDRSSTIEVMGA